MLTKRILSIAFILGLMTSGCQSTVDDSLNSLLDKGTFILGLDATFAPLGFIDENNDIVGFDIDIARLITLRLGVELVLQPIDWDAKILELNSGTIDAIWNGFTITEERRDQVSFSLPYLNNRQIIMTSDSSIETLADLSGKSVGVQLQSSGQTALEASDIFDTIREEVKFDTFDLAIADLLSGRIQAVVIDETMGRYLNSKLDTPLLILTEDLGDEEYGIGFRLGDIELTEKINELLEEIKQDGTASAISIKWFGEDIFLPSFN